MVSLPSLAVASVLPTCLGFWKREYGVSYAYGTAIATNAALVLCTEQVLTTAARWLAIAHLIYGVRLCIFLLWRELSVKRFRDMRERIEARAKDKDTSIKSRLISRTPFIFGCSALYFFMSIPLVAVARGHIEPFAYLGLLIAVYTGLSIAAFADLQKSMTKARDGESKLVTSGLFKFLRHPNYQGEQLLWAASAALGILASTPFTKPWQTLATWTAIILGQVGIQFVLMQATTALNKRQSTTYTDDPDYKSWRAFKGFELPSSDTSASTSSDESTPDDSSGLPGSAAAAVTAG